ncbi:MAG: alginate export family protein [Pseudomonadota bacterium]
MRAPALLFAASALLFAPSTVWAQNLAPDQFDVVPDEEPRAGTSALQPTDWLTLSGELRERATLISDVNFDPDQEDNGWFWTQRLSVTSDVEATPWLRGRLTLLSALTEGGPEGPIERNDLGVQEGYIDIGPTDAFLRVGRQEFVLGSYRLVANREGTNVRRTWDGVRASFARNDWQFDTFALQEVLVEPEGVFNDDSDDSRRLAGVYATGPAPIGSIDLYYLYAEFEDKETIETVADEERHSIGVRSFGEIGQAFWNWEAIYQFGEQGEFDISAWTVAANTGYRFSNLPWSPEFLFSTNIASGDDEQGDGTLGTFNALFPRGSYFSELAQFGPSNFYNVHPYIKAHPREDILIFVDVNFLWRLEEADGIYGPPGNIIRRGGTTDAHFVNTSVSAGIEWEATEHLFFSTLYTRAEAGQFIEDTGPSASIDFVEFTARVRF